MQTLYDKTYNMYMLTASSIREWFKTAMGIRQGCLLSQTLFNISLKIKHVGHQGTVSTKGKAITSLRFADGIDGLG